MVSPSVVTGGFLFAMFPSLVAGGFLFPMSPSINAGDTSPSIGSSPLSLPAILSITRKSLPDWAFITTRPFTSTQQQKDVNLSFGHCSFNPSVKINRSKQVELYKSRTMYLLERISLLSLLFWDISFILYAKYISLLAEKFSLTIWHMNNKVIKESIEVFW